MRDLGDQVDAYKEVFAKYLLRGVEPFTATMAMWPDDVGFAFFTAQQWLNDPTVQDFKDKHSGVVKSNNIPTKDELVAQVFSETKAHFVYIERQAGYKLVAQMLGYIDRGGTVVNNNLVNQRVMMVTDHGTDDDWQVKLQQQQKKLIDVRPNGPSD